MEILAYVLMALVVPLVLPLFELFFIPAGVFVFGAIFVGVEAAMLLAACALVLSLILMMGFYS